ncbi:cobyric acid synthase [Thalassotalea fusca]
MHKFPPTDLTNFAGTLMVQGTTSDAGKSTLVAAICRILANHNVTVAPFKPQNMALNSAVTENGEEIGRAQAVQAIAAKIPLQVDFNPVLLKPQSDTCAQVIVNGKALPAMEAESYHRYKPIAAKAVFAAHQRLSEGFQAVIVEGAGSPAEINLREGDIANMGFAEKVDCPVILVADIDKGGVFAHIVGTLALLSQSEQDRVIGFVINRFRGEISLLQSGLDWLEQHTGKPVLGVLPYIHGLHLAAEDAVENHQTTVNTKLKVVVPVTPRMSNHDDFDALRLHPEIELTFVYAAEHSATRLPDCDLIILAGSKSVSADLAFIRAQGWHEDINRHLRYGGKVFGICGGYQMLGNTILDPLGIESDVKAMPGLELLNISTQLLEHKALVNCHGLMCLNGEQVAVQGYEIHCGETNIGTENALNPLYHIGDRLCGAISADNQIAGGYLHGIFNQDQVVSALANWCNTSISKQEDMSIRQEKAIALLADTVEQHLDMKTLNRLLSNWIQND